MDPGVIAVLGFVAAVFVASYWRAILQMLLITALAGLFAGILMVVATVDQVMRS